MASLLCLILADGSKASSVTRQVGEIFSQPILMSDGIASVPLMLNECIYVSLSDGSVKWRTTMGADKKQFHRLYNGGSMGVVVLGHADRNVTFLAEKTGEVQSSFTLKEPFLRGVVPAGIIAYNPDGHVLKCIDRTGSELWTTVLKIDEGKLAKVSVSGRYIFLCIQGAVYEPKQSAAVLCIDGDSGNEVWRTIIDLNGETSSADMSVYGLANTHICIDVWRTMILVDSTTGKVLQRHTRKHPPVRDYTSGVGMEMANILQDVLIWEDKLVMNFLHKMSDSEKTLQARIEVAELGDLSKQAVYVLEGGAPSPYSTVVGDLLCIGAAQVDLRSGEVMANETAAYRELKYRTSSGMLTKKVRNGTRYFATTRSDEKGKKHRLLVAHKLGTSQATVLLDEIVQPSKTSRP